MTLPNKGSGPITLSMVAVELGKSATANISLNDADVRALANIPSGVISLDNLYGKSRVIVVNPLSPRPAGSYQIVPPQASGFLRFILGTDGYWEFSHQPGTRYQYLTAGSTSSIQARITVTSGTASFNPYADWADIASSRYLSVTIGNASTDPEKSVVFTVEIRDKVTGAILSTTTGCTLSLLPHPKPNTTVKNPLVPKPVASGVSFNSDTVSAFFTIYSNGNYMASATSWDVNDFAEGNVMSSGSVKDTEIRITPTAGSFSYNQAATWTAMPADELSCGVSRSSLGSKWVTFTVEFRDKVSKALLSTTTGCSLTIDVESPM